MTRDWFNSFIECHLDRLCKITSVPQESQRLEVPCCLFEETIQCLGELIQGHPAEFVFNLDEIGISD
jgi:hypothetical protein